MVSPSWSGVILLISVAAIAAEPRAQVRDQGERLGTAQVPEVRPVAPRSVDVAYRLEGQTVFVRLHNNRAVPLDAWEFQVSVLTVSGEPLIAGLRTDFYRDIVYGDKEGQGSVQPGETREERMALSDLASVRGVEMKAALFRDLIFEGDAQSKAVICADRERQSREYGFWVTQLRAVSSMPASSMRATLRSAAAVRAREEPPTADTNLPQVLQQTLTQALDLNDDNLAERLADLADRWQRLRDAGVRHKQTR